MNEKRLTSKDMVEAINSAVKALGGRFEVTYQEIFKNGKKDAYVMRSLDTEGAVGQVFYFADLPLGKELTGREIAELLIATYRESGCEEARRTVYEGVFARENILQKVLPRVYNAEKSTEMDNAGIPYVPCTKAYLTAFYIPVARDTSVTVTNRFLEATGLTVDELARAAAGNAKHSVWISGLAELLKDVLGLTEKEIAQREPDGTVLYVVTNRAKVYGAGMIAVPEVQKMIYRIIGSRDYYVLPSSLHEVLVVPCSAGIPVHVLTEMVDNVNRTEVREDEWLGTTVLAYHYGRGLEIA